MFTSIGFYDFSTYVKLEKEETPTNKIKGVLHVSIGCKSTKTSPRIYSWTIMNLYNMF